MLAGSDWETWGEGQTLGEPAAPEGGGVMPLLSPDDAHFADADAEPPSIAAWFHDLGVHVFPTRNKVPAVPEGASQFDYRCSRAQAVGFSEYGVPGGVRSGHDDGLTIVDADSATTKAWALAHLPGKSFTVTTGPYHDGSDGFGLHLYFRTRGPLPSAIRRDGLSLENRNAGVVYVVGPGSVRPDGVVYRPSRLELAVE